MRLPLAGSKICVCFETSAPHRLAACIVFGAVEAAPSTVSAILPPLCVALI